MLLGLCNSRRHNPFRVGECNLSLIQGWQRIANPGLCYGIPLGFEEGAQIGFSGARKRFNAKVAKGLRKGRNNQPFALLCGHSLCVLCVKYMLFRFRSTFAKNQLAADLRG